MRIAVTGTHFTGKSTFIELITESLKNYEKIKEPYWQLVEEGIRFPKVLLVADFLLQLERSLKNIQSSESDCILDRSPLDFLAYIQCCEDASSFDYDLWEEEIIQKLSRLDAIFYIPVETPDRINCPNDADPELRIKMAFELDSIILKEEWPVQIYSLTGTPEQRVSRALQYIMN